MSDADFASQMTSLGLGISVRGNLFTWFEFPDLEWAHREWGSIDGWCPHYGAFGHVHGGPSYAREACACGKAWS